MNSITTANTQNDCFHKHLPSLDHALSQLELSLSELKNLKTECIALNAALDHVLAEDIVSPIAMPPWDCSAMDGYALYTDKELPQDSEFTVVGTALAGHPYLDKVESNQSVRIMTGAPLPAGTNSVVMQEQVNCKDNIVRLNKSVVSGQNVRQQGSEVRKGQALMSKGTLIGPRQLALLTSVGIEKVSVYNKLKVGIFSTGDELIAPGQELSAGKIYDSNRLTLVALCQRLGFTVRDYGLVADDLKSIEQQMALAATQNDVLITSGGVSVGEADFVKSALDNLGKTSFWKIAIKPGKPILVGRIKDCLCFCLPGNPVSSMVTFEQLAKPALMQLAGIKYQAPALFKATCLTPLRKRPGRMEFQRGFAKVNDHGEWQVSSTGPQGSARLSSMTEANCFIVLDTNASNIESGQKVNIQLFANTLN